METEDRSPIGRWWRHRWLLAIVVAAATTMALLSLLRYWGYNTRAFDLGIMSQAIWSVLEGQPLVFSAQGIAISRLARHVELLYLAIAPIYALSPSPATLLVVQAIAYAAGAIPVWRMASRRLEDGRAALALAGMYLLYPVALTAVLFEFHGDTLAMPLLLFMLDALDNRSRGWYFLWMVLALASKFYVAAPVAILGLTLVWRGDRRLGQWTLLVSLAWGAVALFVIRPLFAPADIYQAQALKATLGSYLDFYFGPLDGILPRVANAMIVFLPSMLLLGWRAPMWLLPAAAVALPALLSSGPGPSYDYRFHHYAIAVPFLVACAVHGAAVMRDASVPDEQKGGRWARKWYRYTIYTLFLTAVLAVLLVDTPINPLSYQAPPLSGRGSDETGYGITSRDAMRTEWLKANVPDDVPVAADRLSALNLVNRRELYLTSGLKARSFGEVLADVDYVVLDGLHDFGLALGGRLYEGGVDENWPALRSVMSDPAFGLAAARDGLLLFERDGAGMGQDVQIIDADMGEGSKGPLQTFGDATALNHVDMEETEPGRYEMHFEWAAGPGLGDRRQLFALTRLEGIEDARVLHLPTLAVLPTTEWPDDQVVRESVSFRLPDDVPPGEYAVWVGWYDSSNIRAAATESESRVGEEYMIGSITVR